MGKEDKEKIVVTLDVPVPRKDKPVTEIALRRPTSGELRGLSLSALLQFDVSALITLLPRITQPTLTGNEVADLDPADLVQIATKVADFLLPKSARSEAEATSQAAVLN